MNIEHTGPKLAPKKKELKAEIGLKSEIVCYRNIKNSTRIKKLYSVFFAIHLLMKIEKIIFVEWELWSPYDYAQLMKLIRLFSRKIFVE